MQLFPNGLGETLGAVVLTSAPLFFSGSVWHVDSTNAAASDASGYGVTKNKPFATLAYAITQATAQDMVVLHDGHTETFTAVQNLTAKALIIAGAGQTDGKPTVKLTLNGTGFGLFEIGDGTVLQNIWFEEQSQTNGAALITCASGVSAILDCYLEADENSNTYLVDVAASASLVLESTTFISNATDVTDLPTGAITVGSGAHVRAKNVTIDANSKGWTTAIQAQDATTRWEALALLGNNKVNVTETDGFHLFMLTSNSEAPQLVEV